MAVVKILKPNKVTKIKREVRMLRKVGDHPLFVKLYDVFYDKKSKLYSLVFEYVKN